MHKGPVKSKEEEKKPQETPEDTQETPEKAPESPQQGLKRPPQNMKMTLLCGSGDDFRAFGRTPTLGVL